VTNPPHYSEIVDAITGVALGEHPSALRCTTCGAFLLDSAHLTGYAYQFTDERTWRVARLFCQSCRRREVTYPTLGAQEVQFEGQVDERDSIRTLQAIKLLDYSGPCC
jgi:hypothetical protein